MLSSLSTTVLRSWRRHWASRARVYVPNSCIVLTLKPHLSIIARHQDYNITWNRTTRHWYDDDDDVYDVVVASIRIIVCSLKRNFIPDLVMMQWMSAYLPSHNHTQPVLSRLHPTCWEVMASRSLCWTVTSSAASPSQTLWSSTRPTARRALSWYAWVWRGLVWAIELQLFSMPFDEIWLLILK